MNSTSDSTPKSSTHNSLLNWPAWKRAFWVLPWLVVLWLAVAWALSEA